MKTIILLRDPAYTDRNLTFIGTPDDAMNLIAPIISMVALEVAETGKTIIVRVSQAAKIFGSNPVAILDRVADLLEPPKVVDPLTIQLTQADFSIAGGLADDGYYKYVVTVCGKEIVGLQVKDQNDAVNASKLAGLISESTGILSNWLNSTANEFPRADVEAEAIQVAPEPAFLPVEEETALSPIAELMSRAQRERALSKALPGNLDKTLRPVEKKRTVASLLVMKEGSDNHLEVLFTGRNPELLKSTSFVGTVQSKLLGEGDVFVIDGGRSVVSFPASFADKYEGILVAALKDHNLANEFEISRREVSARQDEHIVYL